MLQRIHDIIIDTTTGKARTLGEIEERMRAAGFDRVQIDNVLALVITLREHKANAEEEGQPS